MNNWKDYVGLQKIQPDVDRGLAYIMSSVVFSTSAQRLDMYKIAVNEFPYSDDEIGDAVEQTLLEFPSVKCEHPVILDRLKNKVAVDTKRGVANTNFGPSWFYKSNVSPEYDTALVVVQNNNHQYAIVKNPNFEKYGFVIDNTSPMPV